MLENFWVEQLNHQIIQLRQQGLSNKAIIAQLNIKPWQFRALVSALIIAGKLTKRRERKLKVDLAVNVRKFAREQEIIKLRNEGLSLDEIGKRFKITRERVNQIIREIILRQGREVFTAQEGFFNTNQVAEKFGVSEQVIRRLCREGLVGSRRSSTRQGTYLFDKNDLSILENHPRITGKTKCRRCGKDFKTNLKNGDKFCSKQCRLMFKKIRQYKLSQGAKSKKNRVLELKKRLANHVIPENENWVSLVQAYTIAGVYKSTISYLTEQNILQTKNHPKKRWQQKPVRLYAESQLVIMRDVYKQYEDE